MRGKALLIFCGLLSCALAFADADPNQLLAFKKLYVAPVRDNVDGAFQAPVWESYKEIFDRNPRFELVTERAQADTEVQTSIDKKTSGIDVEISLLAIGTGEIFSTDKTTIPAGTGGRETGATVKQLLKTTLKRIPFYGTVTGREGKELTFDIGSAHGLRKGDIIQISRIDHIKRHPLLKSIVDVQVVPVGNAVVDSVEDTIAFGHVNSEITGEQIQKLFKVTAIEARAPEIEKDKSHDTAVPSYNPVVEIDEPETDKPHIGFVGLGLLLGGFSGSSSRNAESTKFAGGAFTPGIRLNGEVWFTKRWFADLSFAASTMSYRQNDVNVIQPPELEGITSSTREFSINVGYKYLVHGTIYGPQAYAKIGFASFAFDTTVDTSQLLIPKTYTGLNLGFGGSLPLVNEDWGAMLNFNILLFPGISESGSETGGEPKSASGVNFFVGGYHYLNPRIAIRAGLIFEIYSADFGETDAKATTNQRIIGFVPSVVYHF